MDKPNYLRYLEEFVDVYKNKPIDNNAGGMGFNHSYLLYYMLKKTIPSYVIESGVWKGFSTYIIDSAVPETKIICLDLDFKRVEYKSKYAEYIETDFNSVDWSKYNNNTNSLCFFDDHQNSLERLKDMRWWGFKKAIFEDNYPTNEGDAYSIKQILNHSGHNKIQLSQDYLPKRKIEKLKRNIEEKVLNKYYFRQNMIRKPNIVDHAGVKINVKEMFELPPVITEKTNQWGKKWENNYVKKDDLIHKKNISNFPKFEKFYHESKKNEFNYFYISYVELS